MNLFEKSSSLIFVGIAILWAFSLLGVYFSKEAEISTLKELSTELQSRLERSVGEKANFEAALMRQNDLIQKNALEREKAEKDLVSERKALQQKYAQTPKREEGKSECEQKLILIQKTLEVFHGTHSKDHDQTR